MKTIREQYQVIALKMIQETVKRKRKRAKKIDEEEDSEIRKKRKKGEDKDKKVQTTIDQLTGNHGEKTYTPMQYHVWAEMYLGGVHPSLNTAPTSTMFNRAGGGGSVKRKRGHTGTSEVVSAIGDLTSALSPRLIPSSSGSTTVSSPAKTIDNCYKQLADLKSLFENNVLSKDEFDAERSVILGVLKKLV